ncbi:VWA domain-containing protein, partial [Corynebacterium hesseae]
MKKLTRALALSAAVTIAGFGGSLGAVAQDAPPPPEAPAAPEAQPEESPEGIGSESSLSEVSQKNLSDFGSCIASEKSADLLFVLDQSASLVGYEGSQPTDADAFRVDATGDIV